MRRVQLYAYPLLHPSLPFSGLPEPELGLEALHVKPLAVPVLLPVLREGVEHLRWT